MSDTLERLRERVEFDSDFAAVKPEVRTLLDIAEAAQGAIQTGTDEDGREWVAAWPGGIPKLHAALAALDSTGGAER